MSLGKPLAPVGCPNVRKVPDLYISALIYQWVRSKKKKSYLLQAVTGLDWLPIYFGAL